MSRVVRIPYPIEKGLPFRVRITFDEGFLALGEEVAAELRQTATTETSYAFESVRDGDAVDLELSAEQTAELPLLPHRLFLNLILADESVDPMSGLPIIEVNVEGSDE